MPKNFHIVGRFAAISLSVLSLFSCMNGVYDGDISDFGNEVGLNVRGIVYGVQSSGISVPIKGMRVVLGMYSTSRLPMKTDTVYTDDKGYYSTRLQILSSEFDNPLAITADDIDGTENGSWSSSTLEITVSKDSQTFDGTLNEFVIDGGNFFLSKK